MSHPSWNALQAAEGLRAIERMLADATILVEELEPESIGEREPRISSGEVAALKRQCESLAELSSQVLQTAEHLPDGELTIDGEELCESAAKDLREGIIDPERVRLAARVLPAAVGWRALAHSLRSGDTHASWDDLPVDELLESFRDATRPAVMRVLEAAGVPEGLDFASCGDEDLSRLAAVLEEHAPTA
jgi:hypothetical protein